ncbi:MAG: hypothetical protein VX700_03925 [Pseudomonadota bacterium]|nr:hypothetical protein [Pseudomonadota bacterium]
MKLLMPAALLIGSTIIAAAIYVGHGSASQLNFSDDLCENLKKAAVFEAVKLRTILKPTSAWDEHPAWDEPARRRVLLAYIRENQTKSSAVNMEELQRLLENPRKVASVWDRFFDIKTAEVFRKRVLLRREILVEKAILAKLKDIGIVRSYYCKL